jgi:WD40 repeat protein
VQVLYFVQNHEPDNYTFPNNVVNTAAIASDGSAFAIGSSDNTIEIWRMKPRGAIQEDWAWVPT